jgi:chromosome segregation ATPase
LQKIQAQLGDLQKGFDLLTTEVVVLRGEVHELRDGMNELHDEMHELRDEMHELRDEVRVGFKATMKQNDRRFLDHEGRIRALERRR